MLQNTKYGTMKWQSVSIAQLATNSEQCMMSNKQQAMHDKQQTKSNARLATKMNDKQQTMSNA